MTEAICSVIFTVWIWLFEDPKAVTLGSKILDVVRHWSVQNLLFTWVNKKWKMKSEGGGLYLPLVPN